jgi:hypothetical protein
MMGGLLCIRNLDSFGCVDLPRSESADVDEHNGITTYHAYQGG